MTEEQIQTQISSQVQEKQVKIFYFDHNDDFFSTHKIPLLIKINDNVFNGFVKLKWDGRDMYYIFSGNNYIKIWKDKKGNILVYMSSVKVKEEFYRGTAEVIFEDRIKYDPETNILDCGFTKIKLEGFEIYNMLLKLDLELISPTFAVICNKLI